MIGVSKVSPKYSALVEGITLPISRISNNRESK